MLTPMYFEYAWICIMCFPNSLSFYKEQFHRKYLLLKDCWKPDQNPLRKVKAMYSPSALCLELPCPESSISAMTKHPTVALSKYLEGFCSLFMRGRGNNLKPVCKLSFNYSSRWKNLIYTLSPWASLALTICFPSAAQWRCLWSTKCMQHCCRYAYRSCTLKTVGLFAGCSEINIGSKSQKYKCQCSVWWSKQLCEFPYQSGLPGWRSIPCIWFMG